MKKLDVRLLRLIKNSKGQFISISLMVVLALMTYVSLSMVADNLNESIDHYYEITNFGDIFIEVVRIPEGAIEKLYGIEGVAQVQGRVSGDVPLNVENQGEKVRVRVVSLPQEQEGINQIYLIAGKGLEGNPKSTLVIQQFFDGRSMELGEMLQPYIGGKTYPLEIMGVVGNPEYIYLMENEQALIPDPASFGIIYVTEDFAQSALGFQGSYNEVLIKVEEGYQGKVEQIAEEIEEELDPYGVRRTVTRENHLSHQMMKQEVESLEMMSTAVTMLFLLVAAVIINVMLSRIVKNDRISIGVMKALGYGNTSIMLHYTKFSLLIGLVGSVIGILLSIPVSMGFTNLYMLYMNIPLFQMKVYYSYIIYGILLTSVFCIASGLMGARSVLNILPADSMKPEAPRAGGRIWLEQIKFIWSRISFSWKMVIRNILRNKRRALFLVLGIGLTCSVVMIPVYISAVWGNMFLLQYGEFQTMEYSVDFSRPMGTQALHELKQLVQVEYLEGKTEFPFELQNGLKKATTNVVGLEASTSLYHFRNPQGEPLALPGEGIILAEGLAKKLGANLGDQLLMKNFMPGQDDRMVEVKGITRQYLGSNAYMSRESLNQLLGEREIVTGALFNSNDQVLTKLKDIPNINQVQSVEEMKSSFLEFMDMIIYSVGTLMLFGGLLGFAIVYNTTLISIGERITEFSSLRVLGFEKKEIFKLITKENALMTGVGIFIGLPLGYGMCSGIASGLSTDLYTIPLVVNGSTYVIAGMATIFFVALAQLATVRKIYRLNFMDALKNRAS